MENVVKDFEFVVLGLGFGGCSFWLKISKFGISGFGVLGLSFEVWF